ESEGARAYGENDRLPPDSLLRGWGHERHERPKSAGIRGGEDKVHGGDEKAERRARIAAALRRKRLERGTRASPHDYRGDEDRFAQRYPPQKRQTEVVPVGEDGKKR
ncbi:unnamed protein product, partial [Ectocarpus sp. 12 AP-2014]